MKFIAFLLFALSSSCATTEDDSMVLDQNVANQPYKKIMLTEKKSLAHYKFNDKKETVEYFTCKKSNFNKTALIHHDSTAGFSPAKVCNDWSAQVFAAKGFNIVAVNRPGFGKSTGKKDFAGGHSQKAILAAARKAMGKSAPTLIWGYSSGSIAAAFSAKAMPGTQILVLGNGIFDTETLNGQPITDKAIDSELKQFMSSEGEDGHEDRSLEWDVEGLPGKIYLYHSENDSVVPFKRAESLRTTLATAEYDVLLFPVKDAKHRILWPLHQQVLRSLLGKIK